MESRRTFLQRSALVAAAPLALSSLSGTSTAEARTPLLPVSADPQWHRLETSVQHRYAKNGNVRLHYVIAGSGPLIVFVHGFPGWWWTWRKQMAALMDHYTVAAIDMRGYGDSGRPVAINAYSAPTLAGDVTAVIQHAGFDQATIVGHDFGGITSWLLAALSPKTVRRFVALNSPHPAAFFRDLHERADQRRAFRYAQTFRLRNAARLPLPAQLQTLFGGRYKRWSPETLATILAVHEIDDFKTHLKAMQRSSIPAALKYYAANIPSEPYPEPSPAFETLRIACPTLIVWGMDDAFLLPHLIEGTEQYLDGPYELAQIPGADHFVHNAQPELVSAKLLDWLTRTDALLA